MASDEQLMAQITRDLENFDRGLKQSSESMKKTPPIFASLQKEAVAAAISVKGIVSGAGGTAWSTFTGSIELVGMRIAQTFIPALLYAAQSAQDFADWLGDPAIRDTVGNIAKVAIAAAGVYIALNLITNPMVLLTGAITAAIIALETLPDIIHGLGAKGHFPLASVMLSMFEIGNNEIWKKIKDLFGAIEEAASPASKLDPRHKDFVGPQQDKPKGLMEDLIDEAKKSFAKNLGIELDKLFPKAGEPREHKNLKLAWNTEMQPRFSTVEEARKQFQLQALKSPLEQESLRLQRESAQKTIELAPKAGSAFDALIWLRDHLGFR